MFNQALDLIKNKDNQWTIGAIILLSIINYNSSISFIHPITSITLISLIGYMLLRIVENQLPKMVTSLGKISISFITGFIIYSAMMCTCIYGQLLIPITHKQSSLAISLVLILITMISLFIKPLEIKKNKPSFIQISKYLPILIIILILCIPLVCNPLAQNNDGFLEKTIQYSRGFPISLSDLRPLFSAIMAGLSNLASLNPLNTYSTIPFLIFISGIIIFWDYAVYTRKQSGLIVSSLLFSPVIAIEIGITRPQVFLLSLTIPLLILSTYAINKKNIISILIGLFTSILMVPIHELGMVFVLIFSSIGIVAIINGVYIQKTIPLKNIAKLFVILLPYALLLPRGLFTQLGGMSKYVLSSINKPEWRWWFISSYKSIDGANLGWPGVQAIYYYLYNGIIILIILAAVSIIIRRRKHSKEYLQLWPTLFFFSFFLFFAEVAPRLGFYFLLNRTWPYICLASVYILVELLANHEPPRKEISKILNILLIGSGIIGSYGIINVAKDNVKDVFPEEKPAIKYISTTDQNSFFISNQQNKTLVNIYGNRPFAYFDATQTDLNQSMTELSTSLLKTVNIEPPKIQTIRSTVTEIDQETETETTTETIKTFKSIKVLTNPSHIYYIFSKRKAEGRNAERKNQYTSNLIMDNVLLPQMSKFQIVFEDENDIIYEIKE